MILKYQRLRQSGLAVFDRRSIANILGLKYASTTPALHRMVKKGILMKLRRDCYVLPEDLSSSSRKIANELIKPSYISFWTALSDAGATTQMPYIVQSATSKRSKNIKIENGITFSFKRLPKELFFGWEINSEKVFRAKPEKALLDILYIQKSGMDWQSVDASELDLGLLELMATRYPARVRRYIKRFYNN